MSIKLQAIHHIAIICSDYVISKHFYTHVLGLKIVAEQYRQQRNSYKLDLALPDGSQIELFSFPHPPVRPSYPEACGLRHLAFSVRNIAMVVKNLEDRGVNVESVRLDELTGRKYTFFHDPDGLPIELYETVQE